MLKNKFGMTKVLVLVLSVLMLVSLVACNKADGPSTDDMNAAIQAAIDAANAEQAAKEAALAASIAADKAAQEAKDAAQAESLAKEKAENDAALKKAQEEAAAAAKKAEEASKAAADAAKKAAEEAAKAAEEAAKANEAALKKAQEEAAAAKKAAEEASKAAAEAAAKAQSEADRVASELAAELEAAKAEALKAQEEAAKAIAEASKAAEEAAKASSQLAETTVVPATTPAETTVVDPAETTVAPETTTEAPVVIVDKTDALLAYSQLKVKYTITNKDMYLTNDYAQIVLLFDKASIDLNNAATAEAAASIVSTLEIDAAAVPSVKNAAAEVQALIAALGDIETEVFTVQAEKILEAQKAYAAFKETYKKNLENLKITDANVKKELGINKAELDLADAKLDVLDAYIKVSLQDSMKDIYALDARQRYDAEATGGVDAQIKAMIGDVYYQYLILAAINDGNVSEADLPVAFEQKRDEATNTMVPDTDKPTKWFTVEDLLNVYILPTLDAEFTNFARYILADFYTATGENGLYRDLSGKTTNPDHIPEYRNVNYELNSIYLALSDELLALSFSKDYKSTATLEEAAKDVVTRSIKAYVDALNVYFAAAKEKATIEFEIDTEEAIKVELAKIDTEEGKIAIEENAALIAKSEALIAKYETAIAGLEADLVAYKANVAAAAMLTYDELLNKDLEDKYENYVDLTDYSALDQYDVEEYLYEVLVDVIATNFAAEIQSSSSATATVAFADLKAAMVADLDNMIKRLSTNPTEYADNNGYGDIFDDLKVEWPAYVTNPAKDFQNQATFETIKAKLTAARNELNAMQNNEVDKYVTVMKDGSYRYEFKDAAAKAYAEEIYEYDPEDYDSIILVVNSEEGLVKTVKEKATTVNSYDESDLHVRYWYKANDQAIAKLVDAYIAAYNLVNKGVNVTDDPTTEDVNEAADNFDGIVDISSLKNISSNAKKKISDGDKTAYNKLVARTSGALKAEIEEVGNSYLNALDTVREDLTKNVAIKKDNLWKKSDKLSDYIANGTFVTIMSADALEAKDFANAYDYDGFADDVDAKVKEFYKNFYGIDTVDTATTAISTVEQLWAYKLDVTADIKNTIATYKNTYVVKATGLYDVTAATALGGQYKYGVVGTDVTGASEAVKAYEDKLDELANAAITYIMGVKINSASKITVSDALGTKLVKDVEIKYNMDKAKSVIDARYDALFGDEAINVHPNNQASDVTFKAGNSEIFKAYNELVLGNVYGYAKVN